MAETHCVATICQPEIHALEELAFETTACLLQIHPVEIESGLVSLDRFPFVIGRDSGCDLPLNDPSVSRRHAVIERTRGSCAIMDCGSTNGVFVNERTVHSQELRAGDQIRIGNRILKFMTSDNIEVQYHETVYSMMTRDSLTGVFNKRYFLESLQRELHRSARHQRPLSLLLFDIDHFKSINDRFGHLAGDDVLRQLGQRVGGELPEDQILARYGGEEFAVILAETSLTDAVAIAERCRDAIAATVFETSAGPLPVTISIGAAETRGVPAIKPADLIQQADEKLYAAKHEGRNCVRF